RALFFEWDDQVHLPNRVIRLWSMAGEQDHQPVEIPVGDDVDEIGFEIPDERLPNGRYLMEFDVRDDGWCPPPKPDLFENGLHVIQLDTSSAEILGSAAGRLDELLKACHEVKSRVIDDILAQPVKAEKALHESGWASLKALFASERPTP